MGKSVQRDLRRVFGLDVALGVVGLVAMIVVVLVGLSSIHLGTPAPKVFVVAGHRLTYPDVNLAAVVVLLLAGMGVAVLAGATRELFRQARRQRMFLGALDIQGPLRGHPGVVVVRGDQPQAFCAGYRRPRIYISTGALDLLARAELAAVLAHERHHCARRDPLRLALIAGLSRSLFVLPVVRRLGDRYSALVELTADEAAVAASSGSPAPLASAMLAFVGEEGHPAVVGIAPERVDHLLGRAARWQPPVALLIVGLVSIAAVVVVAVTAGQAASARTTLNLPVLSSQPCIMMLALIPVLAGTTAVLTLRRVWR